MSTFEIFTIGVYGLTKDQFFNKLTDNKIDTFCDIRRRRGVRGSEYSFVNSKKLQDQLLRLNINYIHIFELSTPDEIRKLQYEADKKINVSQRKRETLSETFISVYKKEILQKFDFQNFINRLKSMGAKRIVLFCVEKNPAACHRSLVAAHLHRKFGYKVQDL
jgi:uncharacterized protein (DUF488 family)